MGNTTPTHAQPLRIAPQGRFDGACFVYSVMNTYKALVAPQKSLLAYSREFGIDGKWASIINVLPSPQDLLNGTGFGQGLTLSHDAEIVEGILVIAFQFLGSRRHQFVVARLTLRELKVKGDFSRSAVLLRMCPSSPTGSHYLCLVDADERNLYLACS